LRFRIVSSGEIAMKPLVTVASFGLVPVPSMLPGWSELHRRIGEREATQAELAELELQLRQAQAELDSKDIAQTSSETPSPSDR